MSDNDKWREIFEAKRRMEADARRYRWLRDTHPADGGLWVAMGSIASGLANWRGEQLDAAIDAELAQEAKL